MPLILLLLLPHAAATDLQKCATQWGITGCLNSYELATDMQHATVTASVNQRVVGSARLLALNGWVYDQNGVLLGSGVLLNTPIELPYGVPVSAQLQLQTDLTPIQLQGMMIQSVRVVVNAQYCLPYQVWTFRGCVHMPDYHYERIFTTAELLALYNQYASQSRLISI